MTRSGDGGKLGDSLATDDTDPRGQSAIREAHAEHEARKRAEAASAPTLVQSGGKGGTQALQPGDLLAGRYKIVRFVAQGGMGQVYEAEDLELRERVALKTVRSEVADDPNAIERFKREIHLARRVTHPNVCRIFDVGFHSNPGGKITFLTMELLEGETLAARLRRTGRMTPADALPIVTQMAEALAAAHQAGIVHRDFKSENVLLSGSRAVITDFGLARGAAVDHASAIALTGAGGIVGSPGYMAPEQVEGGDVKHAADVYALGVVMYEMITGHLPFVGETPLATAVKRLKEPPPPPRQSVPDLDERWNTAILRCLERDPRDRFGSALDIVRMLGGAPVARPRKHRRWAMQTLLGVVILGAAAGVGLAVRSARHSQPSANPTLLQRRSVAVLGFKNLSGRAESAWLGSAFAELLSTELGAGDKLRTVPEENVVRMKADLGLGDVDSLARDTLDKIRKQLDADLVVTGSFLALGDQAGNKLRLDLRLCDAATGETLAQATETGSESELLDLVGRAGAALRGRLGVPALTQKEETVTKALLPSSPEAARLYAEGLAHLRRYEPLAAKNLLEQAIAIDPNLATAHSALSTVYHGLGYEVRAIEESRKAMALSGGLPEQDRLRIEGQYYENIKQWPRSIATYQQLWKSYPDNAQFAMALARAQILGGRAREAFQTVDAARKLTTNPADQARLEVIEAKAAEGISDVKHQLAAAQRAVEKARAIGSRYLEADGWLHQGNALMEIDPKASRAAYGKARDLYVALGARIGLGYVLTNLGGLDYQEGDLAGARENLEQALALDRELGDRENTAVNLNDLANVYSDQGDYAKGRQLLDEAIKLRRDIDDKGGLASSLATLALLETVQGDLSAARKHTQESLELSRAIHRRHTVGYALLVMGELHRLAGDMSAAHMQFEESLVTANEIENTGAAADARFALATVLADEGKLTDAEPMCRRAVEMFSQLKNPPGMRKSHLVLARILASAKRRDEAHKELQAALAIPEKGSGIEARLGDAIEAAKTYELLGDAAHARHALESVIADAKAHALIRYSLEGELELARLHHDKARLAAVQREAGGKGFVLFARP